MADTTYDIQRGKLETYFDRTAVAAWAQLTSTAPVSKIRATVRAGRDRMRSLLLDWLPADLSGASLLDAGCGTGALSAEAARRGAHVVGVDVAGNLIDIARERLPADIAPDQVTFHAGDMLDAAYGDFDHAVAMDSLIHYRVQDIVGALAKLTPRVRRSIVFTVAPATPLLTVMHAAGKLFPRSDRAPAIAPAAIAALKKRIATDPAFAGWTVGRSRRIASGFYTSHALELVRS
jgi:magnesium-protoporphyrin O-methyltransferase